MVHQFFLDRRPHNGLTFAEYFDLMKNAAEKPESSTHSTNERDDSSLAKLNYQRFTRVLKTYKPDESLINKIKNISLPQIWMIISEIWCGDGSQNIPIITKLAEINPLIELRFILRDENIDIMDLYLSDGKSRAIPKLVAFDNTGNELFQWGARPKNAQALVSRLKSEGMEKEKFLEQLHLWYGRDRGKSLEKEFQELFI